MPAAAKWSDVSSAKMQHCTVSLYQLNCSVWTMDMEVQGEIVVQDNILGQIEYFATALKKLCTAQYAVQIYRSYIVCATR